MDHETVDGRLSRYGRDTSLPTFPVSSLHSLRYDGRVRPTGRALPTPHPHFTRLCLSEANEVSVTPPSYIRFFSSPFPCGSLSTHYNMRSFWWYDNFPFPLPLSHYTSLTTSLTEVKMGDGNGGHREPRILSAKDMSSGGVTPVGLIMLYPSEVPMLRLNLLSPYHPFSRGKTVGPRLRVTWDKGNRGTPRQEADNPSFVRSSLSRGLDRSSLMIIIMIIEWISYIIWVLIVRIRKFIQYNIIILFLPGPARSYVTHGPVGRMGWNRSHLSVSWAYSW